MSMKSLYRWSLALALSGALIASPADAPGKGKDKKEKERPELVRRGDARGDLREDLRIREDRRRDEGDRRDRRDARDDDRWDYGVWDEERYEERGGKGPPFCRNGQGHPVHGRRWCEEKGFGLGSDVGRYDPLYSDSRYGGSASYDRQHEEFHLRHDRECRIRASERPLDLPWQIRVRQECKERHDAWHARMGRRHD